MGKGIVLMRLGAGAVETECHDDDDEEQGDGYWDKCKSEVGGMVRLIRSDGFPNLGERAPVERELACWERMK